MDKQILCNVDTCAFNNSGSFCSLNRIEIASATNQLPSSSEQTECMNFQLKS